MNVFKNEDGREFRISPDVNVRFELGSAWICGSGRHDLIELPASALAIITEFASSRKVQDVLASYGPYVDGLDAFIEKVIDAGILVEASSSVVSKEVSSEDLCREFIEPLADTIYRLSTDLRVLSPDGFNQFVKEHGYTVRSLLENICASVKSLEEGLIKVNNLTELSPRSKSTGEIRLNLGARDTSIQGWINVDVYPADVTCNLGRRLSFADGSVNYVFMAHVLEHFFYPDEVLNVLHEIRRVLRVGGALRVVVPDISKYVLAYSRKDYTIFEDKDRHAGRPMTDKTLLEQLLLYAGVSPTPGSLMMSHKFGYDFDTMRKCLLSAGFSSVAESEYMDSSVPELRVDYASKIAGAKSGGAHLSLFVDAWV